MLEMLLKYKVFYIDYEIIRISINADEINRIKIFIKNGIAI
jgi:hypothetical protein